jgi:heme-degrading monooxygenase HmoA
VTTDRVQVLLFAAEPDRPAAVHAAYHAISRRLAGTPGLLGNTLLEKADGSGGFVVVSVWENLATFQRWAAGSAHRDVTAPLRPYHDRSMPAPFGVYRVAAEYPG